MSATPVQQQKPATPASLPPVAERQGLVQWAATKFGVDAGKVFPILKMTCFRGDVDKQSGVIKEPSDAEVAALMIVAREHGLNPFLKEIFAFPDKKGGIVPVVGVDGWIRIVNSHDQYNGVEFLYEKEEAAPAWIECLIHRKDRAHPIKVREYLAECRRDTGPWKSHPSRMLRHKAFIQCARVAFGFAGIYDEDEAERIVEGTVVHENQPAGQQQQQRGSAGLKQAMLTTDGIDLSNTGVETKTEPAKTAEKVLGTLEQRDALIKKFGECKDAEILALTGDEARDLQWSEADQAVINDAYNKRRGELEKA